MNKLNYALLVAADMNRRGEDVQDIDVVIERAEQLAALDYGAVTNPGLRLVASVLDNNRGDVEWSKTTLGRLPGGYNARVNVKAMPVVVKAPSPYGARAPKGKTVRVVGVLSLMAALLAVSFWSLPTVTEVPPTPPGLEQHAVLAERAVDALMTAFRAGTPPLGVMFETSTTALPSTGIINMLLRELPLKKGRGHYVAAWMETPGFMGPTLMQVRESEAEPVSVYFDRLRAWLEADGVTLRVDTCGRARGTGMGLEGWYEPRTRMITLCADRVDLSTPQGLRLLGHEGAHHFQTRLPRLKGELHQVEAEAVGDALLLALRHPVDAWSVEYMRKHGATSADTLERLKPRIVAMVTKMLVAVQDGGVK